MMQYSTHLVLVWSDSYWLNYILVNVFQMLLEFSQETFPNTYMFPVCCKRVIKRGLMGKEQRHVGRHPLSVDPCVPQAAWKCSAPTIKWRGKGGVCFLCCDWIANGVPRACTDLLNQDQSQWYSHVRWWLAVPMLTWNQVIPVRPFLLDVCSVLLSYLV